MGMCTAGDRAAVRVLGIEECGAMSVQSALLLLNAAKTLLQCHELQHGTLLACSRSSNAVPSVSAKPSAAKSLCMPDALSSNLPLPACRYVPPRRHSRLETCLFCSASSTAMYSRSNNSVETEQIRFTIQSSPVFCHGARDCCYCRQLYVLSCKKNWNRVWRVGVSWAAWADSMAETCIVTNIITTEEADASSCLRPPVETMLLHDCPAHGRLGICGSNLQDVAVP